MGAPLLRERMYLIGKGAPWNEVWEMPLSELIALTVTFADIDGIKFDWKARRFLDVEGK